MCLICMNLQKAERGSVLKPVQKKQFDTCQRYVSVQERKYFFGTDLREHVVKPSKTSWIWKLVCEVFVVTVSFR